jgi:DNA replication and repair protein RecF
VAPPVRGYSIKDTGCMKVRHVQLETFRNHTRTALDFGRGVNVFLGRNGQGKTNILEAISCLGLTKSFYAASDATLVQLATDNFIVDGDLSDDAGREYRVRITYSRTSGEKTFAINGVRVERLASVIGMFPMVILSPENNAITFGGPAERRKFVDLVLSQLSRSYFEDLLEYRQVLRQRNKMLADYRQRGGPGSEALAPWNESLALHGARIVHKRGEFIGEFCAFVRNAYAELVDSAEVPDVQYAPAAHITPGEEIPALQDELLRELKEKEREEWKRGLTLVGPHRDEFAFHLNGINLQKYASQGQHKSFLVALKIAEFFYLKERREETPVLLLDDVLSELDQERSRRLLAHVTALGQTIVTTTDQTPFVDALLRGDDHRRYYVEQGTCTPVGNRAGEEATVGA